MSVSMFEVAARKKLRWNHKGSLSVEDLWDLTPKALDEMYGQLVKQKEASTGVSLLSTSTEDADLNLRIAIIKHIVMVKLDEKATRDAAAARSAQKQKILEIIEKKQDAQLHDLSVDQLREMVNGL